MIRHGQTDWNVQRRLQGQSDIPLNEEGRRVAELTGYGMRDIRFDGVYSSPLKRAVETAQILLGLSPTILTGAGGKRTREGGEDLTGLCHMPFYTDPRLQEIGFGVYEGLSTLNRDHALSDPDFHFFLDDPQRYRPPKGGESPAQLIRRTGDFLRALAGGQEGTYLVSTHGAAQRALLANIEHTPLKDFWSGGVPKNCAVSVAVWEDGAWRLEEKDKLFYEDC